MLERLFHENLRGLIFSPSLPFSARRVHIVSRHQRAIATGNDTTGSTKPIPVLLTVRELHHGGIERDVSKIALTLDRSRFEPHVASYQAEGMRFEELSRAGVPLLHLPVTSFKSPTTLTAAMRMRR